MSRACLACHCAISTPFTGMRTIGVTPGTRDAALAICARLSMYCRQSRNSLPSHGLCSISNTQPSNLDVLIATALLISAGAKQVSACWPASSARMTPLRRGRSAIPWSPFFPVGILAHRPEKWLPSFDRGFLKYENAHRRNGDRRRTVSGGTGDRALPRRHAGAADQRAQGRLRLHVATQSSDRYRPAKPAAVPGAGRRTARLSGL